MKEAPLPPGNRFQISRMAVLSSLILCPLIALASMFSCDCPGFFVMVGVFALPALIWGRRIQRVAGIAFGILAIGGFIYESRIEKEREERLRKLQRIIPQEAAKPVPSVSGR